MRERLKEQREERRQTVTEEFSPSFRRRVNKNYLNLTLTNPKMLIDKDRLSPKLRESDYI
jgi:hypothetical protein